MVEGDVGDMQGVVRMGKVEVQQVEGRAGEEAAKA